MADKNRLTQLICDCIQTDDCIAHCNHGPCCTCGQIANYLIENNCAILPHKIGDTIYYINPRNNAIEEDTIIRLTITKTGCNPILDRHTTKFWKHYKWFTSSEAAEEYIKELKNSK